MATRFFLGYLLIIILLQPVKCEEVANNFVSYYLEPPTYVYHVEPEKEKPVGLHPAIRKSLFTSTSSLFRSMRASFSATILTVPYSFTSFNIFLRTAFSSSFSSLRTSFASLILPAISSVYSFFDLFLPASFKFFLPEPLSFFLFPLFKALPFSGFLLRHFTSLLFFNFLLRYLGRFLFHFFLLPSAVFLISFVSVLKFYPAFFPLFFVISPSVLASLAWAFVPFPTIPSFFHYLPSIFRMPSFANLFVAFSIMLVESYLRLSLTGIFVNPKLA
eukprot:GHVT01095285.1.p1 GENE.GHVT01095285.1~~GHVT01095285.1.p1  ORF type:complete len:274 (+),score=21.55 GHVT01095285.1:361-1182(+)